jgi:hypothetical protein
MFKKLKLEVEAIKNTVEAMMTEIASLKECYDDYLEWRRMRDANAESAAKQGHFYITADDTALLERLIQEVNKDPDLAVLMTTAQGTTLSLRTHPHSETKQSFAHKFEGGEA